VPQPKAGRGRPERFEVDAGTLSCDGPVPAAGPLRRHGAHDSGIWSQTCVDLAGRCVNHLPLLLELRNRRPRNSGSHAGRR
jgi:hypothetical protein